LEELHSIGCFAILGAWLYILDTAHQKKIPVGEIIAMNGRLKKTVEAKIKKGKKHSPLNLEKIQYEYR
jgi:hypothetical protein